MDHTQTNPSLNKLTKLVRAVNESTESMVISFSDVHLAMMQAVHLHFCDWLFI